MMIQKYFLLITALLVLSFWGCGAGSDKKDSLKTISGFAVDGVLVGSDLGVDSNKNSSLEPEEILTTTKNDGSYLFEIDKDATGRILVNGGRDLGFNLPFRGTLKSELPGSSTTNLMLTPLTTLLSEGMQESRIKSLFGVGSSVDLLYDNPLESFGLRRAGAKVQALAALMHTSSSQSFEKVYEAIASASQTVLDTDAFEEILGTLNFSDFSTAVMDITQSMTSLDSVSNDLDLSGVVRDFIPKGFEASDISGKGFDYMLEERVAFILFRSDGSVINSRVETKGSLGNSAGAYSGTWEIERDGRLTFHGNQYYGVFTGILTFSNLATYPTTFSLRQITSTSFMADLVISKPNNKLSTTGVTFTASIKCSENAYPIFNLNEGVDSCSALALQ
jgi:hypothetical protein